MLVKTNASSATRKRAKASGTRTSVKGYDLDRQVGYRLRLAMQRHTEIFFAAMDYGLTQPQFAALARLHMTGPCSQNELGRMVALDSATIVGVVSRLEARGLVSGERSQEDRRRVIISLTDEGRKLIKNALAAGMKANELTLAPLSPEEQEQLIGLLQKLVEDRPAAGSPAAK